MLMRRPRFLALMPRLSQCGAQSGLPRIQMYNNEYLITNTLEPKISGAALASPRPLDTNVKQ